MIANSLVKNAFALEKNKNHIFTTANKITGEVIFIFLRIPGTEKKFNSFFVSLICTTQISFHEILRRFEVQQPQKFEFFRRFAHCWPTLPLGILSICWQHISVVMISPGFKKTTIFYFSSIGASPIYRTFWLFNLREMASDVRIDHSQSAVGNCIWINFETGITGVKLLILALHCRFVDVSFAQFLIDVLGSLS